MSKSRGTNVRRMTMAAMMGTMAFVLLSIGVTVCSLT